MKTSIDKETLKTVYKNIDEFHDHVKDTLIWYLRQQVKNSTREIDIAIYRDKDIDLLERQDVLYVEKDKPYITVWMDSKKAIKKNMLNHGLIVPYSLPVVLLVNRDLIKPIIKLYIKNERKRIKKRREKFRNSLLGKLLKLLYEERLHQL